jgi:hypothetical protein
VPAPAREKGQAELILQVRYEFGHDNLNAGQDGTCVGIGSGAN